jgi:hypothetical protein
MAIDPRWKAGNVAGNPGSVPGQSPMQIAGFYPCDNNIWQASGNPASVSQLPAAADGVGGNLTTLSPQSEAGVMGQDYRLAGPNPNVNPTTANAGVGSCAPYLDSQNSIDQGAALNQGLFVDTACMSIGATLAGQGANILAAN